MIREIVYLILVTGFFFAFFARIKKKCAVRIRLFHLEVFERLQILSYLWYTEHSTDGKFDQSNGHKNDIYFFSFALCVALVLSQINLHLLIKLMLATPLSFWISFVLEIDGTSPRGHVQTHY